MLLEYIYQYKSYLAYVHEVTTKGMTIFITQSFDYVITDAHLLMAVESGGYLYQENAHKF